MPSYNLLLWKPVCWLGVRQLMQPQQRGTARWPRVSFPLASWSLLAVPTICSTFSCPSNALLEAAPAAVWWHPGDTGPGLAHLTWLLDWGCCLYLLVRFQAGFGVWRSSSHIPWKIIALQISKALKINIDRAEEWLKVKHIAGLAG